MGHCDDRQLDSRTLKPMPLASLGLEFHITPAAQN